MGLETTPVEPAAPKPSNLSGVPDLTIANHSFTTIYCLYIICIGSVLLPRFTTRTLKPL